MSHASRVGPEAWSQSQGCSGKDVVSDVERPFVGGVGAHREGDGQDDDADADFWSHGSTTVCARFFRGVLECRPGMIPKEDQSLSPEERLYRHWCAGWESIWVPALVGRCGGVAGEGGYWWGEGLGWGSN